MFLEISLFLIAVIGVVSLGIWQSKRGAGGKDNTASGYFLAGRGLTFWLVGFSLIAANISTEQFVGMSGKASDWLGMAIASYEWMAAITLVVVAFVFLPKFLKAGVYTIPEFLEYRYGPFSRFVMAVATLIILVGVPTAAVIYSGATVISGYYPDVPILGSLTAACWLIAIVAAGYVFIGGLKACAWTDLVWGVSLIASGAIVMFLAFNLLGKTPAEELYLTKVATSSATVEQIDMAGSWDRFKLLNDGEPVTGPNSSGGKLNMVRPMDDPEIPWTVLLLGLWIPNFFYWGLNQYIMQRSLAAKSVAEGQKGIVLAAFLKLLIPFVVVIPGILAFNLFSDELHEAAQVRNASHITLLQEGAPRVFTVTDSFATLQPEVTRQAIGHNALLAGQAVPAMTGVYDDALRLLATTTASEARQSNPSLASSHLTGYNYDSTFAVLLRMLIKDKPYISWFVLAAIFGAVVSSLAAMLNSASTIATMDIFNRIFREASQGTLVMAGRTFVVLFVITAAIIAPFLASPHFGGIFSFIQEFQGFISPGILSVFLFGLLVPRAPRFLGWMGIVLNVVLYGSFKFFLADWMIGRGLWFSGTMSFLDRMGLCFILVMSFCAVLTIWKPLKTPVVLPINESMNLQGSKGAMICGIGVVFLTLCLYAIFW